jgi:hypothetical protein
MRKKELGKVTRKKEGEMGDTGGIGKLELD